MCPSGINVYVEVLITLVKTKIKIGDSLIDFYIC